MPPPVTFWRFAEIATPSNVRSAPEAATRYGWNNDVCIPTRKRTADFTQRR